MRDKVPDPDAPLHRQTMHEDHFMELDAERDWPFFEPDYAVSREVRENVRPLSRPAAEDLWRKEVSQVPLERHVMRLPSEHWLRPDEQGPNWIPEWNSDEGSEVQLFLQAHFQLPPGELVYFMLMREVAYQVPIELLARYWRVFLALDDEGPLVLHPPSGRYALFGPNGYLRAGHRR